MGSASSITCAVEASPSQPQFQHPVTSQPATVGSTMSSQRQIWPQARRLRRLGRITQRRAPGSTCLFCSLAPAASATEARNPTRSQRALPPRRHQSTVTAATNPRVELDQTLRELQAQAPNLVNLSRLQLALQGLRQAPGKEAIRVAILGLENGGNAGKTAKRVLRALLADPLVDEQPWERELDNYDPTHPLILRIRARDQNEAVLTMEQGHTLNEVTISSPSLDGLNLELLLMDTELPAALAEASSAQAVEETVLAPMVNIPTAKDRFSPIATPVHKTLLIADGLAGAVSLAALPQPLLEARDSILTATNLEGLSKGGFDSTFEVVDVALAEKALELFRRGPQHAIEFERLWSASNISTLAAWLRAGLASDDQATKPIVRQLIASILQDSISSISAQEARTVSRAFAIKNPPEAGDFHKALDAWAQHAHAELQEELDLAFTGRRWRKLGWWKLFWRVDDVAMLTNEILSQRFLPTTEQELIYLAGRIAGPKGEHPAYPQPTPSVVTDYSATTLGSEELAPISTGLPKWPGHVAFTRRYLQNETVPALQALAQKLVMQSLGTSGMATSIAALLYVSSVASTLYSAGAVAALGIVYSLGRMQKKWETARDFWQGEVREEGRKTIKATEESISTVLDGGSVEQDAELASQELQKARELIAKAEDALTRLK